MHINYSKAAALLIVASQLSFVGLADEIQVDAENPTTISSGEQLSKGSDSFEEVQVAPNLDLKDVTPLPEPVAIILKEEDAKPDNKTEIEVKSSDTVGLGYLGVDIV